MYGKYSFALAPNEQSAMKGFFDQAFVRVSFIIFFYLKKLIGNLNIKIFQVFREYVWFNWYYYTPPAVFTYLLYDWAKKANYEANRKDPAEYANDV